MNHKLSHDTVKVSINKTDVPLGVIAISTYLAQYRNSTCRYVGYQLLLLFYVYEGTMSVSPTNSYSN